MVDNLITGDVKNINQFMNFKNFKFIEHDIQESLFIDDKIPCYSFG